MDNYLDLWNILANELIGDVVLFIIVGSIVIYFLAIKANFHSETTFLLLMLWFIIIYVYTLSQYLILLWIVPILALGVAFYVIVYKKIVIR